MELIHGGDVEGYRLETGKNALDFSANCNPLGVPEGVRLAIAQAAHEADLYPDPLCRRLRRAISGMESVPEDYIFCGNGSAELLYRLALAIKPKKALITAPTFSEYELALRTVDCRIDYFTLNKQTAFALTGGILDSLAALPDIVILCNPNNPTGRTIERSLLLEIIERCKKLGIRLVIDECFVGFLDDPAAHTLKDLLPQNPHVLILQAFTKLYGMAGVRLGYCMCSDTALLELLFKAGQPWSVSHLAQRAGIAALRERELPLRPTIFSLAAHCPDLQSGWQSAES